MDIPSTIEFLKRLYDNPKDRNFARLEHEALGEAIRRLSEMLKKEGKRSESDCKP